MEEYRDLKNKAVSEKELQKAKDYVKGSMSLSLDSSEAQASFYGMQELLEHKILTAEDKFKKLDEVSVKDIKAVAEDIFAKEKLNLAIIGPIEDSKKEQLKKILKI